ncbi:hypothetical protein DRN86_04530 [Candidatus Geothermarchaeota archaeon]|nr:MAG: hypothetical protein DRN86_04530 [Candidatus Geothermarchaeota archaeon]
MKVIRIVDLQAFLIIITFLITGIILAIISALGFKGIKAFRNLSYVFILKALGDVFLLIAMFFKYYLEFRLIYVISISSYGYSYLASVVVLAAWLHKELYEEKGRMALLSFAPLLAVTYVPMEKVYSLIIAGFHVGLTTAVSFYAVFLSLKMARKRKGGSLLWVLGAIYAILIAIAPTGSVIITLLSLISPSPIYDIIFVLMVFLIDVVSIIIYLYYRKVIMPILAQVL